MLAEEGIELNAVDYQRQVEEREAQRRQEREERLAREAMMTLQAMEQQEQKAAAFIHNEGTNGEGLSSVEPSLVFIMACSTAGVETCCEPFGLNMIHSHPGLLLARRWLLSIPGGNLFKVSKRSFVL